MGSKSKYRLTKKIWRYASNDVISGSRDQNRDISAWVTTQDLGWFRKLCLVSKISCFFAVKLFTRKYSLPPVLKQFSGRPATKRASSILSAGLPLILIENPSPAGLPLIMVDNPWTAGLPLIMVDNPWTAGLPLILSKVPGRPACHLYGYKVPGQPACHLYEYKVSGRPACHLYGSKVRGRTRLATYTDIKPLVS